MHDGKLRIKLNGRILTRLPHHGWIAGVCVGLAANTGTDPLWWRVGFIVAAAAMPGVTFWPVAAIYALLAFCLPRSGD